MNLRQADVEPTVSVTAYNDTKRLFFFPLRYACSRKLPPLLSMANQILPTVTLQAFANAVGNPTPQRPLPGPVCSRARAITQQNHPLARLPTVFAGLAYHMRDI